MDVRQRGLRQVRAITGWAAAASAVATVGLAVGIAGGGVAAGATTPPAGDPVPAGDGTQGQFSTGQDGSPGDTGTSGQPGDGLTPPAQVPGSGSGGLGFGGGHASSGGS